MAQRTENEETEFKVVPESLTLCINNCGVVGNPATNNMCQKCFNNSTATSSSTAAAPVSVGGSGGGMLLMRNNTSTRRLRSPVRSSDPVGRDLDRPAEAVSGADQAVVRQVSRCSGCRRKVGLTGFRCRCGDLFCAEHRYSDRHDCSYDYKAAGREAIARDNPVVKAAKIVRI